jgi:hypothetical protein
MWIQALTYPDLLVLYTEAGTDVRGYKCECSGDAGAEVRDYRCWCVGMQVLTYTVTGLLYEYRRIYS